MCVSVKREEEKLPFQPGFSNIVFGVVQRNVISEVSPKLLKKVAKSAAKGEMRVMEEPT